MWPSASSCWSRVRSNSADSSADVSAARPIRVRNADGSHRRLGFRRRCAPSRPFSRAASVRKEGAARRALHSPEANAIFHAKRGNRQTFPVPVHQTGMQDQKVTTRGYTGTACFSEPSALRPEPSPKRLGDGSGALEAPFKTGDAQRFEGTIGVDRSTQRSRFRGAVGGVARTGPTPRPGSRAQTAHCSARSRRRRARRAGPLPERGAVMERPPSMGRFHFVAVAALRAGQLMAGCRPRVEGDRHPAPPHRSAGLVRNTTGANL